MITSENIKIPDSIDSSMMEHIIKDAKIKELRIMYDALK